MLELKVTVIRIRGKYMEIINDDVEINYWIDKYRIDELFISDMRKYMSLHMWKAGEYICKEGEQLDYILFVVKGKAKVYKNFQNGKSLLICFYNPLKIIGDMEFTRTNMADCSVQAIKDTYAVGMKLQDVQNILINDCNFLRNICDYLGKKLSTNSTNSAINLLYPLENRLASYILAFLNFEDEDINRYVDDRNIDLQKYTRDNIKFEFEGNYNEIAELLGTSYRHLSRTINKMCSDKIINKCGRSYEILNLKKLISLSGDLYK